MAFHDMERIFYEGAIKINYMDKAHIYIKRERVNWDLNAKNPKAWGEAKRPKGVTTLIGDTLEKNGLLTWPMGLALGELFGFYDFTKGSQRLTGFSKGKGTLWQDENEDESTGNKRIGDYLAEDLLPVVLSASKAWQRKKKKGADIGSVVHDAIEHFINRQLFDIGVEYMESIKAAEYESEADRIRAFEEFPEDVKQAQAAFEQFQKWWEAEQPELLASEELVYSRENDYCGTFDFLGRIQGKLIIADWKSSNASESADAPMGVYYSYFIQSALYAAAFHEMGGGLVDDLLVVSVRKDGGFDLVYASSLGLTVTDCIEWAQAVVLCYRRMAHSKKKLNELGALKYVEI